METSVQTPPPSAVLKTWLFLVSAHPILLSIIVTCERSPGWVIATCPFDSCRSVPTTTAATSTTIIEITIAALVLLLI